MDIMSYQTIKVRFQEQICFVQFYRPDADNSINDVFIRECHEVLTLCEKEATIVVIEGLPEVFCMGADFQSVCNMVENGQMNEHQPGPLYDLWLKLATGPFISIAHVRGKANAGGVGFVAACDIVLADATAQFSLSELLFGLFPACVLPFLVRRIGLQKANYMSLMTQPIPAQQAHLWGLVDVFDGQSDNQLRKHLLRLKRLSKTAVTRYKHYMCQLDNSIVHFKPTALAANYEVFTDADNLNGIYKFVQTGAFPWENRS